MAHALSITDETTTISLSTGSYVLVHYVPQPPVFDPLTGQYSDVTETVEGLISAATAALARDALYALETLLTTARVRYAQGTGPRCYIVLRADVDTEDWRSEIVSYVLTPAQDSGLSYGQGKLGYTLTITRRFYWEGARAAVPLTNGNGTNNTSGLTLYNHDDGDATHDNFATIAANIIKGTQPAPAEIKVVNNSGASRWYYNFHVSNSPYPTFTHIIEGESALGGYGTAAVLEGASGGSHATLTGAGWKTFAWTIPAATLQSFRGRYARILARFSGLSGIRKVTTQMYNFSNLSPLGREATVFTSNGGIADIQDCGAIAFPSAGYSSSWAECVLRVGVYSDNSEQVGIDFLQLTPTEPGLYRRFRQAGYLTPVTDGLVDDGPAGILYYNDGTTGAKYPIVYGMGSPLTLLPNVAQRLTVLFDGTSITNAHTIALQVWYRPRRLTW